MRHVHIFMGSGWSMHVPVTFVPKRTAGMNGHNHNHPCSTTLGCWYTSGIFWAYLRRIPRDKGTVLLHEVIFVASVVKLTKIFPVLL